MNLFVCLIEWRTSNHSAIQFNAINLLPLTPEEINAIEWMRPGVNSLHLIISLRALAALKWEWSVIDGIAELISLIPSIKTIHLISCFIYGIRSINLLL